MDRKWAGNGIIDINDIDIIEAIDTIEIVEGIEIIIMIIIIIIIISIGIFLTVTTSLILLTLVIPLKPMTTLTTLTKWTSVGENQNLVNFCHISTICISNESWDHSKFKFDIRSYDLLFKIRHRNDFSIFLYRRNCWLADFDAILWLDLATYQKNFFTNRC